MSHPTIFDFLKQFPNDAACLAHLFEVRFGQAYVCPDCRKPGRWYPLAKRRAYTCQWCGHHLYPCVGTPFEASRTPLTSWFFAICLFTTSRHGVAAKELERQLGVTYKTAWRMAHEIRKHMAVVDGEEPLSGVVEVDETYVGGHRPGKPGRGAVGKTIIVGMVERDGGVVTKVVPNVRKGTLEPVIEANVTKGSTVHTDELASYRGLTGKGYTHETVNHGAGEYVVGPPPYG
jgi:transposase-like protein